MSTSTPAGQSMLKVRQSDGAIICGHQVYRGQCNKVVTSATGAVACANRHSHTLDDLRLALVQHPETSLQAMLEQLSLPDEGINAILEAATSREVIGRNPEPLDLTTNWMALWPEKFCYLLNQADSCNPVAARLLRDAWEKQLAQTDPVVYQYLAQLKSRRDKHEYLLFRAEALVAWHRAGYRDPMRQLTWGEIQMRAADVVDHEADGSGYYAYYADNYAQAQQWAMGKTPTPIYFRDCNVWDGTSFTIQLDPYWRQRQFWCDHAQVVIKPSDCLKEFSYSANTTAGTDFTERLTAAFIAFSERCERAHRPDSMEPYPLYSVENGCIKVCITNPISWESDEEKCLWIVRDLVHAFKDFAF